MKVQDLVTTANDQKAELESLDRIVEELTGRFLTTDARRDMWLMECREFVQPEKRKGFGLIAQMILYLESRLEDLLSQEVTL